MKKCPKCGCAITLKCRDCGHIMCPTCDAEAFSFPKKTRKPKTGKPKKGVK